MEHPSAAKREYVDCKHVKRTIPDITIDEDLIKSITEVDYLPLFEDRLHRYKLTRYSSLVNNELLKCRWKEFVNEYAGRERAPYNFPSVNDLHFCKYLVMYKPTETIRNRVNNKYQLRLGPGVDHYGQLPIPDDMQLRKTVRETKTDKPKIHKK